MSIYIFIYICLYMYLYFYLSIHLYPPLYLSIYLCICLSVCPYLSIYLSICLSMYLSIYQSIYLSIYIYIYIYSGIWGRERPRMPDSRKISMMSLTPFSSSSSFSMITCPGELTFNEKARKLSKRRPVGAAARPPCTMTRAHVEFQKGPRQPVFPGSMFTWNFHPAPRSR